MLSGSALWSGKGKEGRYGYCSVLYGFTNKTTMSHLLVEFSCSCMLYFLGCCVSFSSPRSVEFHVLNKIVCLSDCFPPVFDEITPS